MGWRKKKEKQPGHELLLSMHEMGRWVYGKKKAGTISTGSGKRRGNGLFEFYRDPSLEQADTVLVIIV